MTTGSKNINRTGGTGPSLLVRAHFPKLCGEVLGKPPDREKGASHGPQGQPRLRRCRKRRDRRVRKNPRRSARTPRSVSRTITRHALASIKIFRCGSSEQNKGGTHPRAFRLPRNRTERRRGRNPTGEADTSHSYFSSYAASLEKR